MQTRFPGRAALFMLALVALPRAATSQTGTCRDTKGLTLAFGAGQHDRVDASTSPGQFQGRGIEGMLAGVVETRAACLVTSAAAGTRSLSAVSGSFGREQMFDGNVGLDLLRPITNADSRFTLSLGVAARADLSMTAHYFNDPNQTRSWYRMGVLSLGPVIHASTNVRGLRVVSSLSTPLVAAVDHSYGAVWRGAISPDFRAATPTTLRGVEAQLGVIRPIGARTSLSFTYDVHALRYDDALPVRTLSQRILLGITLHPRIRP
jgi:hypothetical protein